LRLLPGPEVADVLAAVGRDLGRFVHARGGAASELARIAERAQARHRQPAAEQCAAFEGDLWTWLRSLDPRSLVGAVEATRLATFVRTHLNERLTLKRLASVTGWPSRYLSRRFRQHHGVGIQEYIRRQRVLAAEGLVRKGEKIEWVTGAVGYRNRTHFNEAFRRHTGVTPIEYRRQAAGVANRSRDRRAI
jgi:transcriptional regulator GlxA family with amidase domain